MRRWYNEGINSWKAMIFSWRHIYWNFPWFRNIVFLKRPGLLWYGYRVVCGLMEVQHDVLRAQRNCWSYFHFPDLSKPWKRMWHEWHKEQMKRACNKISVFSGNITSFLYVFPKLYFVWPVHPRTSTLRKKKNLHPSQNIWVDQHLPLWQTQKVQNRRRLRFHKKEWQKVQVGKGMKGS